MLGESNSLTKVFADLTLREKVILYPVVALIVLIGVYPAPLLGLSELAVNNVLTIASQVTGPMK